jgi:hypothetical protein
VLSAADAVLQMPGIIARSIIFVSIRMKVSCIE